MPALGLEHRGELQRAIDENSLVLYYQPKLRVRSLSILGIESLVRWPFKARELLLPGDFLPLAEETGLIRPLLEWGLRRALAQIALWRGDGLKLFTAVNLSAKNLADPRLELTFKQLLRVGGTDAAQLTLEIPAAALSAANTATLDWLAGLRRGGVRIALDGLDELEVPLGLITRCPLDELKISPRLFARLALDPRVALAVRQLIAACRATGLVTVAVGVENDGGLRLAEELGCDAGQGNYLSPPLPPSDLVAWLRSRPD
ncbi:MAG: hypothetical protein AUH85_15570 [Chloroflexi bacterium 13_1_40CM_4_68_4]|nr:MAG: hypothetical protein AUH85_15570 [Chloroflexi bacterium 13_1_40CM_4_68_4]